MRKNEFIAGLRKKLSGFPEQELKERLGFYSEMIDDRIEEGLSEEDAILAVGTVDEIASQIAKELCLELPAGKTNSKNFKPIEIVLLILGAPLWLALAIAAFAVVISVYAVLWSLNVCLWAVELPFLIFFYISKCFLPICKKATEGSLWLTKKGALWVKSIFTGKAER